VTIPASVGVADHKHATKAVTRGILHALLLLPPLLLLLFIVLLVFFGIIAIIVACRYTLIQFCR